ncbi:MAG: O-antigen ligase family protein [Pyrinomonadaceae bacterium]|nr:O-antigen ligase family protein [Pyrinomonadaceae bacterium]
MPEIAASNELAQKASIELPRSSVREPLRGRLARLLDETIFFSLLTLVVLIAIPSGKEVLWWDAVFECAVFALVLMWIIHCFLSGVWHVGGKSLLAPLVALIIFACVQTLPLPSANTIEGIESVAGRAVSADPYETRLFVFRLFALTLAGALLLRFTSNRSRLRALIHVVIGVGVASALFGITRQAIQNGEWKLTVYTHYRVWVDLLHFRLDEGYRQFGNRIHFAFLMEMTLGLALGLIAGGGVRRNRLPVYLVAAAMVWTALVFTTSRGAILSMLSQLIFIALVVTGAQPSQEAWWPTNRSLSWKWRISRSLITRAALVACLVVAVVLSVIWVGGDTLVTRLESVPGELSVESTPERTGARRIEIWRATWRLIRANTVAGVGFGGYRAAIPEYRDASGEWTPEQAHNDYLELLASGGLIGAAFGTWFLVALIRLARERLRTTDSYRRATCLGGLAGLFGVAVHSLFDYGLHITINAFVFTVLIAIAVVNGRVENKHLS